MPMNETLRIDGPGAGGRPGSPSFHERPDHATLALAATGFRLYPNALITEQEMSAKRTRARTTTIDQKD
jgi:hypothetical protein